MLGVEKFLASNRIGHIKTLYGALLVLVRFSGQCLLPVEVWRNGVAVLVLGDEVCLVAAVCRVGKTCAQDGVANPIDKLLILRIGHLGLVHPESVNRNVLHWRLLAPKAVLLLDSHVQESARNLRHSVRRWLGEAFATANACHFAAAARNRTAPAAHARCKSDKCRNGKDDKNILPFHLYQYLNNNCKINAQPSARP